MRPLPLPQPAFLRLFHALTIFCYMRGIFAANCATATVRAGDTCFSLATASGLTTAQLLAFNPGVDCNLLVAGQRLCVSSGSLPGKPVRNPDGTCATYTTKAGDSCAAIDAALGIAVADIERWNAGTWHWNGCAGLQVAYTLCVSDGTPPSPPIDPNAQCGPTSAGNTTCPLKACCSAFGFCGLTDEFCSTSGANKCQSNCGTAQLPSCAGGGAPGRRLGYYAGWAARRACTPFAPSQLDLAGYSHAVFAFAGISQGLTISLAGNDDPLLRQLAGLKTTNKGLKVLVAVGGWAFSEDDNTKDLFSVMISTSANRATFIGSVKSFLSSYGLDGIDIDFEYPAAMERAAPASDTPNLTAFFKELRIALPSAVISAATPAGYWFLRGFEIDKIIGSVSFLNMMSYDYHGPWDTNVTGQAPLASPHTSLADIQDSARLYVKAGIDLSKVNVGMAWYGRSYHLADAACAGYACTMTGGGAPGKCTAASGVLAQFEVLDLLGSAKATLDAASQTYWFVKDGDLVTFDLSDTWLAKQRFAGSTCFGGTFVWSLDQVKPTKSASLPPSSTSSPASAPPPTPTRCGSLKDDAQAQAQRLMNDFKPKDCSPAHKDGPVCLYGQWVDSSDSQPLRLWTNVISLEAMYNYATYTGDRQWDDIIQHQGLPGVYPRLDGQNDADTSRLELEFTSYDDAGWVGLLYVKLHEYFPAAPGQSDKFYLSMAGRIHDYMSPAWDASTCGGGLIQVSGAKNKNTITTELFFHLSVSLALATGDAKYTDWAHKLADWLTTGPGRNLQAADGLWVDGLSEQDCRSATGPKWSYNQGVIVSALGMMHKMTGDGKYKDAAVRTIDGVVNGGGSAIDIELVNGIMKEASDDAEGCKNFCGNIMDQYTFKGLFMRHLHYFLDTVNDNALAFKYADFIGSQASAIVHFATRKDGDAGNVWYAPSKGGSKFNPKTKTAGLDGLLAGMKYARC